MQQNEGCAQVRQHMADVGVRRFQDLIGRTDLLKVRDNNDNPKARLLNLSLILKNALHMRPGVNILAGSKSQVRPIALIRSSLILQIPAI
jgi:glutamate synthase (NADH)